MKLKLIATLALATIGSANAAIQNGASGNGELFAVVASASMGASFVIDLGQTMTTDHVLPQFNSGIVNSYTFTTDASNAAVWNAFYTPAVAAATDLQFGVIALDATGTGSNGRNMLTTTAPTLTTANVKATTNGNFGTAVTNYDTSLLTSVNGLYDAGANQATTMTTDVTNNGAAWQTTSNSATYFYGQGLSSNYATAWGKLSFSVLADANTVANFGKVSVSSSVASSAVNYTSMGSASFDASTGTLTIAPVPEADTYAMMLAGLGLVGYAVRRKLS